MKRLILLICFSLAFSQELKVEGNLNVTGAVINDSLVQVIDSLKTQLTVQQTLMEQLESSNNNHESLISSLQALIAQLQAQIASMQTQVAQLQIQTGIADCNGEVGGDAILDYCGLCEGIVMDNICPHGETGCYEIEEISGTNIRILLESGKRPPKHIMRPEIIDAFDKNEMFVK